MGTEMDGQFGKIYRKECGSRRNTYDLEFSTQSCELLEGDSCVPNPTAGMDICGIGLECSEESKTCVDAFATSSSSSSSYYSSSSSSESSSSSDYYSNFI